MVGSSRSGGGMPKTMKLLAGRNVNGCMICRWRWFAEVVGLQKRRSQYGFCGARSFRRQIRKQWMFRLTPCACKALQARCEPATWLFSCRTPCAFPPPCATAANQDGGRPE